MTTRILILTALLVASVSAQQGVQVSETTNPAVIAGVLGSLQNPPGGVFTITGQTGLVPNPWAQYLFGPRPCRRPRPPRPYRPAFFWGFRGRSGRPTSPAANSNSPNTNSTTTAPTTTAPTTTAPTTTAPTTTAPTTTAPTKAKP